MRIYQRKETGIYYLKIREGSKYRCISLSTKNRYVAEQLYNAYLLDKVKDRLSSLAPERMISEVLCRTGCSKDKVQNKLNVRRNSDIVSISAFQTSCLHSYPIENKSIYNHIQIPITDSQYDIEKTYNKYLELCKSQNLSKEMYYIQKQGC